MGRRSSPPDGPKRWYSHKPAEFWTDERVEMLDLEAVGLLIFLQDREWQKGSLPDDEEVLKRLVRGRVSTWEPLWQQVRPFFDSDDDGRLTSARMRENQVEAEERSTQSRAAAQGRWQKEKARNAAALRPHSERTATAMPLQDRTRQDRTSQEKKPKPGGTRRRPRRNAPCWEDVLNRVDYVALKESSEFCRAWNDWVEHAQAPGTKANVPVGKQAATLFNRALKHGVPVFVEAVEAAIANDWQGINPGWGGSRRRGSASKGEVLQRATRKWGVS